LSPDELEIRGDVLLFWAENEAVVLWGIQCERLEEADPPVMVALNRDAGLEWTPNSARLSDFLDDRTYENAHAMRNEMAARDRRLRRCAGLC
jgi:hypothetical protein